MLFRTPRPQGSLRHLHLGQRSTDIRASGSIGRGKKKVSWGEIELFMLFGSRLKELNFCFSWTEVIKSAVDELKKRKGSGLDRHRAGSIPSSAIGPAYGSWVWFFTNIKALQTLYCSLHNLFIHLFLPLVSIILLLAPRRMALFYWKVTVVRFF